MIDLSLLESADVDLFPNFEGTPIKREALTHVPDSE